MFHNVFFFIGIARLNTHTVSFKPHAQIIVFKLCTYFSLLEVHSCFNDSLLVCYQCILLRSDLSACILKLMRFCPYLQRLSSQNMIYFLQRVRNSYPGISSEKQKTYTHYYRREELGLILG